MGPCRRFNTHALNLNLIMRIMRREIWTTKVRFLEDNNGFENYKKRRIFLYDEMRTIC